MKASFITQLKSWSAIFGCLTLLVSLITPALSQQQGGTESEISEAARQRMSRTAALSKDSRDSSDALASPDRLRFRFGREQKGPVPPLYFEITDTQGRAIQAGCLGQDGSPGLNFEALKPSAKIMWLRNELAIQLVSRCRRVLCVSSPGRPLFSINFPIGPDSPSVLEVDMGDPDVRKGLEWCRGIDGWFTRVFGSGRELGILPGIFKSAYTLRESALSCFNDLPDSGDSQVLQLAEKTPAGAPLDSIIEMHPQRGPAPGLSQVLIQRIQPGCDPSLARLLAETLRFEAGSEDSDERASEGDDSTGKALLNFLRKGKVTNPSQYLLLGLTQGNFSDRNSLSEYLKKNFKAIGSSLPRLETARDSSQRKQTAGMEPPPEIPFPAPKPEPSREKGDNFGWTQLGKEQPQAASTAISPAQDLSSGSELKGLLAGKMTEISNEIKAFRVGFDKLFQELESKTLSPGDFSLRHDALWQSMNRILAVDRSGHMWGEAAGWYVKFLSYLPEESPLRREAEQAMAIAVEELEKNVKAISGRTRDIASALATRDEKYLQRLSSLEQRLQDWTAGLRTLRECGKEILALAPGSESSKPDGLLRVWKSLTNRFQQWSDQAAPLLSKKQLEPADLQMINSLLSEASELSRPLELAQAWQNTFEKNCLANYQELMKDYQFCRDRLNSSALTLAKEMGIQDFPSLAVTCGPPGREREVDPNAIVRTMEAFQLLAREFAGSGIQERLSGIQNSTSKLQALAAFLEKAGTGEKLFAAKAEKPDNLKSGATSESYSGGPGDVFKENDATPGKILCDTDRIFVNDCRILDLSTPVYLDRSFLSEGKVILTGEIKHNLESLGGMAVSFDSGKTWDLAEGKEFWIYSFFPPRGRTLDIMVKAVTPQGEEIQGTFRKIHLVLR